MAWNERARPEGWHHVKSVITAQFVHYNTMQYNASSAHHVTGLPVPGCIAEIRVVGLEGGQPATEAHDSGAACLVSLSNPVGG
eukprot:scaffold671035_cov84-Prasinocladus_malaysianus.AAC.1